MKTRNEPQKLNNRLIFFQRRNNKPAAAVENQAANSRSDPRKIQQTLKKQQQGMQNRNFQPGPVQSARKPVGAERSAQTEQSSQNQRPVQNQQASALNTRMTQGMRRRAMKKAGFSMSRRISASYIQMVVDSFLSFLVLMLIVYIAYHSFVLALDVKQISEDISMTQSMQETIYEIAMQRDTELALSDTSGEILVNTFGQWQKPYERLPIWFYRRGNAVFIMIQNWVSRTEGIFTINVFRDITPILTELVVLFSFVVFLGALVVLTIYLRGRSVTRNVLYPIAEVTRMTKEITGQNLNLRMNVTNAKDELKELIITFNGMMDRIETAYNKQNQFVSDASHELRTPISVIQGYARMLERWGKEDPEVLQESIEAIRNESDNMKELVDKLLFIARNDKDTLILTKENFSLSEMMEELVKETKMVDEQHTIEGSVESEIDIFGDRNRIKQAMRIFVDNAQKYTEPGKTISISLKKEEKTAILSVKDSGCGITAKDLHNVFDRFFRADESRDRNKGGHGLGLSIAKIIVLRHGGKINVRSKVDEGSVFSIILNIEPKADKTSVQ